MKDQKGNVLKEFAVCYIFSLLDFKRNVLHELWRLKQLAQQNLMLIHGMQEQINSSNFQKLDNTVLKSLKLSVSTEVDWDDLNAKLNDEEVYAALVIIFSHVLSVPNLFFSLFPFINRLFICRAGKCPT